MAVKKRSKQELFLELSELLKDSEPDGQSTTDEKYAEGKISKDAYYKVSRGNAERLLLKKSF